MPSSLQSQAPLSLIHYHSFLKLLAPQLDPQILPNSGPTDDSHYQLADIYLIRTTFSNSWSDVAKIYNHLWAPQQHIPTTDRTYPAVTAQEIKERWERMIQMPENERGMMRYWVKMRRTLDQEYSVRILGDVYDVNFLELAMWNMAFRAEQVGVVLVERAEVEEILGIRSSVVDVV